MSCPVIQMMMAGGQKSTTCDLVDTASNTTAKSCSLGAEQSDRYIFVAVLDASNRANAVTVGGNSASMLLNSNNIFTLWALSLPLGANATVAVGNILAPINVSFAVYRVTGLGSTTPFDSAIGGASQNIDVTSGGLVISMALGGPAATGTFTGLTTDFGYTTAAFNASFGHGEFPLEQMPLAVSCNTTNLVTGSWGP